MAFQISLTRSQHQHPSPRTYVVVDVESVIKRSTTKELSGNAFVYGSCMSNTPAKSTMILLFGKGG